MWKNNLFSLLFILSIASIISTEEVFKSMTQQQVLLYEFNTNDLKTPLETIEIFNYNYPNISTTAIPLASFIGMYYFVNKKYEKAIEFLHQGKKANPYFKISDSYLSRVYDVLKVKDSFSYYAKKTFYESPNHPLHLAQYLKSLDLEKSKDSIELEAAFNLISKKQDATWQNYLAAAINAQLNYNTLKQNALKAKKLYPSNPSINIAVSNVLYGTQAIGESYVYSKIADSLFNLKSYKSSISNYNKALELYPTNVKFKENLAIAYYSSKEYKNAIDTLLEIIEDPLATNSGKIEMILGLSYAEIDQKSQGCDYLTKAIIKGYPGAENAKLKYCY